MLHRSIADDQQQRGICWQEKDDCFIPIGHHQIAEPVPRSNNEGLLDSLNRLPEGSSGRIDSHQNNLFQITQGQLRRGTYFPRIVRPIYGETTIQTGQTLKNVWDHNYLRAIRKQEEILIELIESIFRNIHPHKDNYNVYGHQIRNLIILATTEVESSLTAILQANNVQPINRHYTTQDYVRIKNILRLEEFEVSLLHYPWLQPFSPFRGWHEDRPTQSLTWYNAYNKIKHYRENEFKEAILLHSINALIAVHILLIAQFGNWATYNPYFKFNNEPCWPREELYISPEQPDEWEPVNVDI